MFQYPSNDLQNPRLLTSILGSFWSSYYGSTEFVRAYTGFRGQLEQQNFANLLETQGCIGRSSIPIFHCETWYPIVIKKSQKTLAPPPSFGSGFVFGNQPNTGAALTYGRSSNPTVAYPTPPNLISTALIHEQPSSPSAALVTNIDFILDVPNQVFRFRDDPFDNQLFPTQLIFDQDGNAIDTELTLWLFQSDFDTSFIYDFFGFVLNVNLPSSQSYLELTNALYDDLVGGSSVDILARALAKIADAPIVKTEGEVVETLFQDANNKWVATDQNIYSSNLSANTTVSVGHVLHKGDQLTDAVAIHNLNTGQIPPGLASLTTGPGFLYGAFQGPLTFVNETTPWVVTFDSFGNTFVSFDITGNASDVTLFWNLVHQRGLAAGKTLAQYLDQRTNPVGQPNASNIPATVNPLQFLISNLLVNCILVILKPGSFGSSAYGTNITNLVYKAIIPPQYGVIQVLT